MARCIFNLWIVVAFWPLTALAAGTTATDTGVPAPAAKPNAGDTTVTPAAGDYWTYDAIDQITGKTTSVTFIVTDETPSAIAVRRTVDGKPETTANTVYTRSWSVLNNGVWHFKPDDGTGIELPLSVGKSWPIHGSSVNSLRGFTRQRLGSAKVVAQERLTTKAGVFSTYKIQTSWIARDTHNPTLRLQYELVTWFAPAIDHWAKRITTLRTEGLLREKTELVLTKWGRAKSSAGDVQ